MNDLLIFGAALFSYLVLRLALGALVRLLKKQLGESYAGVAPLIPPIHLLIVAGSLFAAFLVFDRDATMVRTFLAIVLAWNAVRLITFLITEVYFRFLKGVLVPRVLKNVIAGAQYVALAFVFFHVVSGVSVGDLLVVAAVVALIAGITFQSLLTVFFVGLSTSLQDKFRVGDLVRIGDIEGRVVEISWRSTTIRTRENDIVTAPNRLVAESLITNFHRPEKRHRSTVRVRVHPSAPPNRVKRILIESASAADGVQTSPAPHASLAQFHDDVVEYAVSFWVADYEDGTDIEERVRTLAWYRLSREGAPPAPNAERLDTKRASVSSTLAQVPIFSVVAEKQLSELEQSAQLETYGKGELVFREGEPGDSLYVVKSGAVAILVDRPRDGKTSMRPTIEPGGMFGERSVLTGENRSASARALMDSELIVIRKAHVLELLRADPAAAERISRVMVERDQDNMELTMSGQVEREASKLLSRVREFFAL